MQVLKESDAKNQASAKARQNGHDLRPWRRQPSAHFRNYASCKNCRATVEVISTIIEEEQAEHIFLSGEIIGRFEGTNATRADFTRAIGTALVSRCRG